METELLPIVASVSAAVDVVFVHGLDGDPIQTWRLDQPDSWPTWLKADLPNVNAWSLRYRLRSLGWQGGAMPLLTRATNVLAVLDTELTQSRPIVFMCHSYGGLLVKQLLRSGLDVAVEYRPLIDRVAGIVFFGTPNSGSTVATFVDKLQPLLDTGSAVEELSRSSPLLQNLSYWFRNNAEKWMLRVYFETMPMKGVIVVDESSADLGISSVIPVGIDANHLTICKPTTKDLRVKQSFALIGKITESRPQSISTPSWMGRIISTPNDQLHLMRAELEAELSERPGNVEARKALADLNRVVATVDAQARVRPGSGGGGFSLVDYSPVSAILVLFLFFLVFFLGRTLGWF
jgi:hypothetical protein